MFIAVILVIFFLIIISIALNMSVDAIGEMEGIFLLIAGGALLLVLGGGAFLFYAVPGLANEGPSFSFGEKATTQALQETTVLRDAPVGIQLQQE